MIPGEGRQGWEGEPWRRLGRTGRTLQEKVGTAGGAFQEEVGKRRGNTPGKGWEEWNIGLALGRGSSRMYLYKRFNFI